MSSTQAFTIEVQGHSAGIVIAERGGFLFFAAEQAFRSLDQQRFRHVAHAEQAVRGILAGYPARHRL